MQPDQHESPDTTQPQQLSNPFPDTTQPTLPQAEPASPAATAPVPLEPAPAQPVEAYRDERQTKLRSLLIKMMLGCVIAAATVAVIAVLAGSMNEIAWKAIGTIVAALIHILILLAIVSTASPSNVALAKTSNYVINSSIVIVTLSFFTSIFNIWGVLEGEIFWKLYATYLVALVTVIHSKVVMDIEIMYDKVRPYAYANYGFMLLVATLLLGAVYAPSEWQLLDGFYGRLLAASVIIDVTLTAVIAVMHRLFMQKHPELRAQTARQKTSVGRIILTVVGVIALLWVVGIIISFVAVMMSLRS